MSRGHRFVRSGIAAVAVVVLALGAAGCSSGSDSSSSSTTAQGPSTTATAKPLVILVTNDDGYAAEGIDTLVEALRKLPDVDVKVVAPATNQSGVGAKTTEGTLSHSDVKTRSGYPAVAVEGHPADTIRVALDDLGIEPDLVVAGVNFGQNLGPLLDISGTVGAARAAARRGIPAVAASQGLGDPVAYDVGAGAVVEWVKGHRQTLTLSKAPLATIVNINAPSCGTTGQPRGPVDVPPATAGPPLSTADCSSSLTDPTDDVIALNAGYVVVDEVPAEPASPPTS